MAAISWNQQKMCFSFISLPEPAIYLNTSTSIKISHKGKCPYANEINYV